MTSLIVDASVAAKWFVQEPDSDAAKRAGEAVDSLIAPELILAEVANVLWKKAIKRSLEPDAAIAVIHDLPKFFTQLIPSAVLARRALEFACSLKHPVYDCFYLALAEREDAPILSADNRLLALGAKLGSIEIRPL
jgi:predicted nucleic acid-binding protein